MNDRYSKDNLAFMEAMSPENKKWRSRSNSTEVSNTSRENIDHAYNNTIVVLELKDLDMRLSKIDDIRDKITFLICYHRQNNDEGKYKKEGSLDDMMNELEVVIPLESPGGAVS